MGDRKAGPRFGFLGLLAAMVRSERRIQRRSETSTLRARFQQRIYAIPWAEKLTCKVQRTKDIFITFRAGVTTVRVHCVHLIFISRLQCHMRQLFLFIYFSSRLLMSY